MDEATEDLLAPETRDKLRWCDDCAGLGCAKLQPAMRSSSVVVQNEPGEDRFELSSGDDQKVVETFLADGSDPSLGVGVRVRPPHRRCEDLSALCSEDVREETSSDGNYPFAAGT